MRELFAQQTQGQSYKNIHMDPVQIENDAPGPLGLPDITVDLHLDELDFSWINTFLSAYKIIATIVILVLAALLIYILIRLHDLRKKEWELFVTSLIPEEVDAPHRNMRWERVQDLFTSDNEADWRVAIIEADSMLEDLLIHLGYEGDSLGERLQGVDRGNFAALDHAWDAHMVRNQIAHQGMNYSLSSGDALRVMKLYQHVFLDAGYI